MSLASIVVYIKLLKLEDSFMFTTVDLLLLIIV